MNNKSSPNGLDYSRCSSLLPALDVLQILVLSLGHEDDGAATGMDRGSLEVKQFLFGHQDSGSLRPPDELVTRKIDCVLLAKAVDVICNLLDKNLRF